MGAGGLGVADEDGFEGVSRGFPADVAGTGEWISLNAPSDGGPRTAGVAGGFDGESGFGAGRVAGHGEREEPCNQRRVGEFHGA